MFSSWFGRGSKRDGTTETIVNLRAHLDTLHRKVTFTEQRRDEEERTARALVVTNKAKARVALQKKKKYEKEIDMYYQQMTSFEQQLAALESANLNRETMRHMQQGADAMRRINEGMNVDKLDDTMDQIRDQLAMNEEIQAAISQPIVNVDDADLEAELEEFEQQQLDDQMVHAAPAPSTAMPEVPKQKLGNGAQAAEPDAAVDDEEEELRQLEREMAG